MRGRQASPRRLPKRMTDLSDSAPAGRPSPSSAGAIVLARHGEPALSRKIKLDARAYDRWWATYETGGILPGQTPPPLLLEAADRAQTVFSSTRRRAIETAETVLAGKPFTADAMFVEAPLPAPATPAWLRLGPKAWGVIARALWWFSATTRVRRRAAMRRRAPAPSPPA